MDEVFSPPQEIKPEDEMMKYPKSNVFREGMYVRVTARDPVTGDVTGREWQKFLFISTYHKDKLRCYTNGKKKEPLHLIDLSKV